MNPAASLPIPIDAPAASPTDAHEQPPEVDLVTITRVFNTLEAEMLRGCLGAEGIPATLGDVQTVQTDTLLTVAMGGVRIMVPAPFADAARQTIAAFERGALAIDELPDDADAGIGAEPAEAESAGGIRLSRTTWLVLAVVIVAVVIF